jgi:hypothetical protein
VISYIERWVAAAGNEMAPFGRLPLVQVPSSHKSSCASVVVPEEQREIEGVQVDSQRYTVEHQMWASQSIRQHQNEGMYNSSFYYLYNWSYMLLWFLWTTIHNANNN